MSRPLPDDRWLKLQVAVEKKTPPDDAFLRNVYNVMIGELEHEDIKYALELYLTHEYRDTLVSFFLSGATTAQIEQGTRVTADVLVIFEKLFIDLTTFRNKLEWRAYAEFYVAKCCAGDAGQKEVKKGVLDGPIALLAHWRIGNEYIMLSDQEILTQQVILAHTKALASRNAGITDIEAKEAFKWAQFAVNTAARRSNVQDTGEMETDAIVAIQKRKATLDANEAGLSLSEILH